MEISLDDANYLADLMNGRLEPFYSGRGMYGKSCVGVIVDDMSDVISGIFNLGIEVGEGSHEFADFPADTTCTDSMGLNTIVYWPRLRIAEEDVKAAEDAEEERD